MAVKACYQLSFKSQTIELDSSISPNFGAGTSIPSNQVAIINSLFKQIKAQKWTSDFKIIECTYISNEGPQGCRVYEVTVAPIVESNTTACAGLRSCIHITSWRRSNEED